MLPTRATSDLRANRVQGRITALSACLTFGSARTGEPWARS